MRLPGVRDGQEYDSGGGGALACCTNYSVSSRLRPIEGVLSLTLGARAWFGAAMLVKPSDGKRHETNECVVICGSVPGFNLRNAKFVLVELGRTVKERTQRYL